MKHTPDTSIHTAPDPGAEGPRSVDRPGRLRLRLILVGVSLCAYVLTFILVETIYGKGGATTIVLPVAAVSWLFGLVPGVLSACLAFPVNFLMYSIMDAERQELFGGGGIAGMSAIVIVAVALGRLRDLGRRLSSELAERKRTEEALRASRDQLQNLIETSLDPIVITDARALVIKANAAFLAMIGYREQDVVGKSLYCFSVIVSDCYEATTGEQIKVEERFIEQHRETMMEALYRDGKLSNWATYFLNRARKLVPVTTNIVFSYDSDGQPLGSFAIIRDITEQRRAELELIASREAAVEANLFRSRFFANITHEFRTPLTLAIGPLEGMLRGEFGPIGGDMQEQLSVALRNSRHLLKLVNQLLDFSMIESGTSSLFWEHRDVASLTSAVLDAFSVIASRKKMSVVFDVEAGLGPVPIDASRVEKTLFNLLGNAFRFTPEGGSITVSLGRAPAALPDDEIAVTQASAPDISADSHIRLCVRDTGVGIRREHLTVVFDRFKQAGENLALERGGSGIGLAHTRELIESMHGIITAKSQPGAGSQFCVYLPCEQSEAGPFVPAAEGVGAQELALNVEVETADLDEKDSSCLSSISGGRPLLMVVDDNADVLRYIAGIVRAEYDFVGAENGREALGLLERYVPDVIISDIMMPEMDGYELLLQLKSDEKWRSVPFVFLTAKADAEMRVEGLEAGADDYISKPFNSLELLARVKAVLRLKNLQQETDQQRREIAVLTRRLQSTDSYGSIVGSSPPMRAVYQLLESIKKTDSHVLIDGETGTGKELVARSIHENSRRSQESFISVNCGAIPVDLMESEFFGHVKGAFTGAVRDARGLFQEADGGTLFLDEIGEMSLDLQVKLLRVLESGDFMRVGSSTPTRVDVRIIVATNKNLRDEVRAGRFREDLFFRINIIPVHLPPLRERREDIALLIEHFLARYAEKHAVDQPRLSPKDMAFLLEYAYPGNVRELQNMLERLCLMGGDAEKLFGAQVMAGVRPADVARDIDGVLAADEPLKEARSRVEKDIIVKALEIYNNNHTQAAGALKISRAALYKKIKQYGIRDEDV